MGGITHFQNKVLTGSTNVDRLTGHKRRNNSPEEAQAMQVTPRIQAVLDAIAEVLEEMTTNGNVKTENLKKTQALLANKKKKDKK